MITVPTPDVSVILPTYNRAALLDRAIISVLEQTAHNIELIVVDDASDDETTQVLRSYTDPRLITLRHPVRRGAAAARNSGIRISRGDMIAFQDSDDWWEPQKLARQIAYLRASPPRVAVVYCRFRHIGPGHNIVRASLTRVLASQLAVPGRQLQGDLSAALVRGNFITTQTALIRRECLLTVGGFDEQLSRFQDWDLWLRIAQQYQFAYLTAPLVTTYVAPARISDDAGALETAFARLVSKHAGSLPYGYEIVAQQRYALGLATWRRAGARQSLGMILRAIALSPATSVYWVAAARALLSSSLPHLAITPPTDYTG